MSTIILSPDVDAHIPYVARHLSEPPIIIGAQFATEKKELSFVANNGTGNRIECIYDGKLIANPTSVWLRRPFAALDGGLPVADKYFDYTASAVKLHTGALYTLFPEALWVSSEIAIKRAAYKPLQHNVAAAIGFRLPETLFTSRAEAAQQFIDNHKATVIKVIAHTFPLSDPNAKEAATLFSRKVSKGKKLDLSGLHVAPTIFQEAIDTDFDIRVTVVGDKVFAASVRLNHKPSGDYAKMLDWRVGHYSGSLDIQPYNLPKDIAEKCVEHAKRLGLEFSAIDLIMDKRKNIWFIENNPNGQWAFVEHETGQPIGKALAELLERGKV